MRAKEFADVLREARLQSGKTVKDVSKLLTSMGVKGSEKTIYGWEKGTSQPSPDTLLLLCKFYGVKDILGAFGYDKKMEFLEEDHSVSELKSSVQSALLDLFSSLGFLQEDGSISSEDEEFLRGLMTITNAYLQNRRKEV